MLRNAGLMDQRDYDTYLSLFNHMANFMRKPNVIIHLEVSPEASLDRIKARARGCETAITLDYLRGLHAAYEEFIADISRVRPRLLFFFFFFGRDRRRARDRAGHPRHQGRLGEIPVDGRRRRLRARRVPQDRRHPPRRLLGELDDAAARPRRVAQRRCVRGVLSALPGRRELLPTVTPPPPRIHCVFLSLGGCGVCSCLLGGAARRGVCRYPLPRRQIHTHFPNSRSFQEENSSNVRQNTLVEPKLSRSR